MITVWFADDVLDKISNLNATLRSCENCVVQYVMTECKREGRIQASSRVRSQLCEIVIEAISEFDPHLRDLLDLTYRQVDRSTGSVEVRMSLRFKYFCTDANPGTMCIH